MTRVLPVRPPVWPPASAAARYLADRSEAGVPHTRLHAGVDLGGAPGAVVVAPEPGVVVESAAVDAAPGSRRRWSGYGPGVVLMAGESGRYHLLSHLAAEPLPAPGATLAAGQPIGIVSALRHIHWEVRTRPRRTRQNETTVELSLDPVAWLAGIDRPFPWGRSTDTSACLPKLDFHSSSTSSPRPCNLLRPSSSNSPRPCNLLRRASLSIAELNWAWLLSCLSL